MYAWPIIRDSPMFPPLQKEIGNPSQLYIYTSQPIDMFSEAEPGSTALLWFCTRGMAPPVVFESAA